MNILIDIGHPAHVHLFKNFAHQMIKNGHRVIFTLRNKEFELALLEREGFHFISLGSKYKSRCGKLFGLIKFTFQIIKISFNFRPDVFLSHGSMYAAFAAFFFHKSHISFEDSFNFEQIRLYKPFTDCILTATYKHPYLGKNNVRYNGYHEVAYLHPNYFTPDKGIKELLGVNLNERYFIVRFVSWDASHDIGQSGLSVEQKFSLIKLLQKYGKVFISSEGILPLELEVYRFSLPPEKMHDALAFADLFIGEGVTMASEAAILGTHAVYVNSLQRPYTTEQEKNYSLVSNFKNGDKILEEIILLLEDANLKLSSKEASMRLLKDKIDVSAFLVWFVENYPVSKKIMLDNPNYQLKFK